MLILLIFRGINMRGKVFAKINQKLGIKTNLSTKGVEVIGFNIALSIIVPIIYNWFNTFIDLPIFNVLLDPLNKIPPFFDASGVEYPTSGGIENLSILM